MDCKKMIDELSKETSKILERNGVSVSDLDWVFAQVKAKISSLGKYQ